MRGRLKRYVCTAVGAAVGAAALTAFLIAPGQASAQQKAPFFGANLAHRGLYRADGRIPENSRAAFSAAASCGYGVELDVRLTADGVPVVCHDETLRRLCGVDARVDALTLAELRRWPVRGSAEPLLRLSDALSCIGGCVPVVLELKHARRRGALCRTVYALLQAYSGAVCVESFDPLIVRWWRRHAPEVLRGQLSRPMSRFAGELCAPAAFALSRLLTNFLGRPQFIAYDVCGGKPLTVRLCERMSAMKFAWTCHSRAHEAENDAVIFEFCRPAPRFK